MIGFLFFLYCLQIFNVSFCAPYTDRESNFYEEYGNKFEGDILLSVTQIRAIQSEIAGERNGLRGLAKRWPNNTVVYHIEDDDFDEDQINMIEEGMEDISNHSCIKFTPRKKKSEHAVVIQGSEGGCYSSVGLIDEDEENQYLNLAKGCFRHGTVVHEMLHTIGFYHMQSTYDRDDYVKIEWDNIINGYEGNFLKYNNDTVTDFGVPYDYGSVMHYHETAFTKNGNRTIVPLQENAVIGQRNGMSDQDILKLNRMYCNNDFIDNKINRNV